VRKLLSEQASIQEQQISGIDFDLPLKAARNIFEVTIFQIPSRRKQQ
jgi:hypothetical protein